MIEKLKENSIPYTEFKNGIVINADCRDVIEYLDFDHVIVDPPYGILQHKIETGLDFKECIKLIHNNKKNINFCFFGLEPSYSDWAVETYKYFPYIQEIIWNKKNNSNIFNNVSKIHEKFLISGYGVINDVKIPYEEHLLITEQNISSVNRCINMFREIINKENCIIKFKQRIYEGIKIFNKESVQNVGSIIINNPKKEEAIYRVIRSMMCTGFRVSSIMKYATETKENRKQDKNFAHPTQKPTKLLDVLIQLISNENETILDFCLGSGTTAISCINKGRRFIGIEIDKGYYEMSCERIRMREDEYLF